MSPAGPLAALVALALPPAGLVPAAEQTRCVVTDPRIDEASGLVDTGSLMVTTNDSGDTGRLFVLDRHCRTVGVTSYGAADDAEALAPGGAGRVWVGDLGDNTSSRDDVVVRRVPVARGERTVSATAYRLVYPDGPHDAETLLRDPRTGRLYVVTKQLLSSQVYAAPRRLVADRPNRLRAVAKVSLTPTDGSFLRDGRRVVLRGYASASVYTFPGWRLLGAVRLPEQQQGESLSVGPGDRVRIGSEGLDQPILDVRLPQRVLHDTDSGSDSARRDEESAARTGQDRPMVDDPGSAARLPLLVGVGLALLAGLGLGLGVVLRRRG